MFESSVLALSIWHILLSRQYYIQLIHFTIVFPFNKTLDLSLASIVISCFLYVKIINALKPYVNNINGSRNHKCIIMVC